MQLPTNHRWHFSLLGFFKIHFFFYYFALFFELPSQSVKVAHVSEHYRG